MASPKWEASYKRWQERINTHPGQTAAILFASAVHRVPAAVRDGRAGRSAEGRTSGCSSRTCLAGRFLRFLALVGAADWLVHLF